MTLQELIQEIYYAYRGKGASKTPVAGSEKYNTAVSIANRKQREWATDSNQTWNSLFSIEDVDTIALATKTYDLADEFMTPSDKFIVTKTTGDDIEIKLTSPQNRGTGVYISGNNPKKVTFTTIDAAFDGGTLKAPGYYMPAPLVDPTDPVVVDDPNWLVYATAAELARNDAAKDAEFPNLLGMANDLYRKMINANLSQGYPQGQVIPTDARIIGDESNEDWTE